MTEATLITSLIEHSSKASTAFIGNSSKTIKNCKPALNIKGSPDILKTKDTYNLNNNDRAKTKNLPHESSMTGRPPSPHPRRLYAVEKKEAKDGKGEMRPNLTPTSRSNQLAVILDEVCDLATCACIAGTVSWWANPEKYTITDVRLTQPFRETQGRKPFRQEWSFLWRFHPFFKQSQITHPTLIPLFVS